MLMAEQFVFHPFGEELKINIEDGGAGGERIRSMRVTHLATPAFLDLDGTHETVQPPFTDPRPALMQTIAWHGTPAKLAINSKHSIYGSAACTHAKPSLGTGPLQSLQLIQNKGDAQRRQRARQKTQITVVHSL